MRKLGKNDLSMSFKEKSDMSRDFYLSRLTGWQRQVAENSSEKPLIRLVLALEGSEYIEKHSAVVTRMRFDEKILYNNMDIIKSVLGKNIMVYSQGNFAKKFAKEYPDYVQQPSFFN